MNTIYRDLVEYSGICEELPIYIENHSVFSVDDFIRLESDKQEISQICKVSVKAAVNNCRFVKSNMGNSFGGTVAKGFKMICEACIDWRIEYTDTVNNTIFSTTGKTSFNSYVQLSNSCKYTSPISSIYVEDAYIELLDSTTFMLNFTGMIIVENN